MNKRDLSFCKTERLKSNKEISRVFNDGIFLFTSHLSLKYIVDDKNDLKFHQIAVSVPKKKFKSAVKRNRIKRLIKEAYRLNKNILYDKNTDTAVLKMIFIYKSYKISTYKSIQDEMIHLLNMVKSKHSK